MDPDATPDEADPIAALDQALRGLSDVARMIRAYYENLVNEGFKPAEALALTIAYQGAWVAGLAGGR